MKIFIVAEFFLYKRPLTSLRHMSFSFTSVQTLKFRHISCRYGLHLPAFFNCHTPIIECSNISITDPSLIFFLTCSLYYIFCALCYLIYMQQISSPNRPVVARGVQRISELVALTFSQPMRKKFFLALHLIFDFLVWRLGNLDLALANLGVALRKLSSS